MTENERKTVFMLGAGASKGSVYNLPCMSGFFEEQIDDEQLEDFLRWFYQDASRDTYNLEAVLSYLELARTRAAQWGYAHKTKFQAQSLFDATIGYVKKGFAYPLIQKFVVIT